MLEKVSKRRDAVGNLWTGIVTFLGILVGMGFYDVYVREKIDTV